MDVLSRVKGVLFTPETEWLGIEKEPGTPGYLFPYYVVYLAAIPPLAGFIGASIIGMSAGSAGTVRVPLFAGLLGAVIGYVLSFAVIYALAMLIDQFASRFGGARDFANALKLAVYSLTPFWLAGFFQLIAGLRFVGYVLSFYGIYVLWTGLPRLMRAPADRAVAYVATVAASAIVIMLVIALIAGVLIG